MASFPIAKLSAVWCLTLKGSKELLAAGVRLGSSEVFVFLLPDSDHSTNIKITQAFVVIPPI